MSTLKGSLVEDVADRGWHMKYFANTNSIMLFALSVRVKPNGNFDGANAYNGDFVAVNGASTEVRRKRRV